MPWGLIDDAAIAVARKRLGEELTDDRVRWVTEANIDAIRHFAEGSGDRNPLWNEPAYGPSTRWGGLVAPPTFLYAVDLPHTAVELPGVSWFDGGAEWVWYDYVRLGDAVDSRTVFDSMNEKSGRFADRWVLQTNRTTYTATAQGEGERVVGVVLAHSARLPRGPELNADGRKPKNQPREPHRYTTGELQAIEEAMLAEKPRGAEPRYWEDVQIGDTLPTLVRGPLTTTDMIGMYSGMTGARPYGGTFVDGIKYRRRTGQYIASEVGTMEAIGYGHLSAGAAEDLGIAGAYDIGPCRITWAATATNNWMGDDGFLHRLNIRLISNNLVGDTIWVNGTVTDKQRSDRHFLAHLELKATNQLGEVSAAGSAEVALPSREMGAVAMPLPPTPSTC
jgi:acyl dehydratase